MRIEPSDSGAVIIEGLDSFLLELLRQLPHLADTSGSDAAQQRVFSEPAGADEECFRADWREFVQPGLRHLFQNAMQIVQEDVAGAEEQVVEERRTFRVTVPAAHLDAWLNALNQARLALAARHALDEADMDAGVPSGITSPRALAVFQVHFFGYLQECLLQRLTEGGEG